MSVNYIKHLETVTLRMAEDTRLNTSHVSMYLALFLIWNHNRFQNPLSINRSEVMKISKIGARATYHKCMTELHQWGYLKYVPSHNPLKGSMIYLFNFGTTSEQVVSQLGGQLPSQVLGPSINNININKHINNTNIRGEDTNNFKDDMLVVPQAQVEKKKSIFNKPSLDEVKAFFQDKNKTDLEAEKFFNHFESNGWLVGGKSKMKNWQAAARNWIFRAASYTQKANPTMYRLNVTQNTNYNEPL